uniref:C2H2-type domain-containing protein n=1 Tax=Cacopsylla melanoneura TaxID=428564 RepID=A0A8D9E5B3_9HEMI
MSGPLSVLNLFLASFILILVVLTSLHKVESKTTLSKLQYINAIRDILEGLIKSLATRQKVEYKRRVDLNEYRRLHRNRLGQDILVCKLCREIFTDPHKYFDHAHYHVVEKLQLSMTTSGNFPCQMCGNTSFVNQFELYKHCYEDHLASNWDKLTTQPPSTTTMKPNYAESLYCKICNITLPYAEKFYIHSYQHLQENMGLIMNQTTSTATPDVIETSNVVIDNGQRDSGLEDMAHVEHERGESRAIQDITHPRNASKTNGYCEHSHPEEVTNRDSPEQNKRFKRNLKPDDLFSNIPHNVNITAKTEDELFDTNKTTLHVYEDGQGTTDSWINLYSTASRIIEKFFQTQVRIVRITKDLRTTKKVTLKPYPGEEEFTGDDFAGESGEIRYERLLKKMRKNKVYVKCPYCPLRFYYNPEMMNHIRVRHNLSDHFKDQTTVDVPFQTHLPNGTKYNDDDAEEFIANFPTYDYDMFSTTKTPSALTTQSTTFNMEAFSDAMAKILRADYLKGFLTTAKSTRNIDYLYRDRTYATTMANLHQMEAQLRNARDYLRQMASTLLQNPDYTYDETTESAAEQTESLKAHQTNAGVKPNNGGVIIEEITTARRDNQKELVQEGLKEVEQQLQNVQEMKKQYSAVTNLMQDGLRATQAKRFTQKIDGIKEIFRSDRMRTWKQTTVNQTEEEDNIRSVEVFRRYKKIRKKQMTTNKIRPTGNVDYTKFKRDPTKPKIKREKRTTEKYQLLYNTELRLTTNEQLQQVMEILRRTRPVNQFYRHLFDYKRRLGPTEMSYEDSQETQLTTTLSPEQIEQIRAEQYAKYMTSLTTAAPLPTTPLTDYEKFLQQLAELKRAERLKKEQAAADYEEKLKQAEAEIDEASTPLMMNVNDMFKYRGEDEEQNKRVADAFKFIVKNDVREVIWNSTKDADQTIMTLDNAPHITYDDGFGELDYETMTQYAYDPTDMGVFYMETPRTSLFITHRKHTWSKLKTTVSIRYTWPPPGYTGTTMYYVPKPKTEKITISSKHRPRLHPMF